MTVTRSKSRRAAVCLCGAVVTAAIVIAGDGNASSPAAASTTTPTDESGAAFIDAVNQRIGLNRSDLVRLDADPTPGVDQRIVIEIDGQLRTIEARRHSVRSSNFHTYRDVNDELIEIEPAPVRTYRGVLAEDPGSLVAITVDASGVTGQIVQSDRSAYWVEPVAPHFADVFETGVALAGLHVVYQDEDVVDMGHECGTNNLAAEVADRLRGGGGGDGGGGGPANPGGGNSICEIAFDCGLTYTTRYGEAGIESRIETIVNSGLNIQYPRDVEIIYSITAFIFRTSQVYPSSDIGVVLSQFRSRWLSNHGDIIRDVAELFIGRNLSGNVIGIAYLSGICNSNGFNVVEDLSSFSCRVDLSAHELGHNWSADHCSCSQHTMNAGLTCRRVFHPTFTIPQIVAFRNSRNCLSSELPPANDDCGSAIPIGDGTFPFDTGAATDDGPALPAECDEGGGLDFVQDIWFDYTAPCTGEVGIGMCNSQYDTRLAVYEGQSCFGTLIDCNDDACSEQSGLFFPATAGQHYRIRIGGVTGGGNGSLIMICQPGPDCPEDLDMSGAVDFGDINTLLAAWGNAGGPEDLDNSGFVDFGDLLAVLAAWGPC